VNAVIAVLAAEGEDVKAAAASGGAAPAKAEKPEPKQEKAAESPAPSAEPSTEQASAKEAKPVAPMQASGNGREQTGERVFASPLARRLAKESGVDLSAIAGSGPRGRIVKADVESAPAGQARPATGAPAATPSAAVKAMSDE